MVNVKSDLSVSIISNAHFEYEAETYEKEKSAINTTKFE